MARKVRFEINYGEHILLDMDDAKKVMDILDGKSIAVAGWVGDEQVHYLRDEGYSCPVSFDTPKLYCTESEYQQRKDTYEEAKENAA